MSTCGELRTDPVYRMIMPAVFSVSQSGHPAYDFTMRHVCLILCGWFFATGSAFAQTVATVPAGVGFDCWIGADGKPYYTHYIRCMADRDLPHPELSNPYSDALLDLLHRELHQRSGADAERIFKTNIELVRETRSVWNIRIHSYPSDWSWQEGTPERLVRAVLCPQEGQCTVMIRPR